MRRTLVLVQGLCSLLVSSVALCEPDSLPSLDDSVVRDAVAVGGQAADGSAPITVYDLSYPVRTALGSGTSMDDNGYFAVLVSPPLIAGHQIVAEDAQGRVSSPVTVEELPVDDTNAAGAP